MPIRSRIRPAVILLLALILVSPMTVFAQSRPEAEDCLPETTVVFVKIRNIKELVEKLQTTGFGQMLQDEKVAPLAQELYSKSKEAFDEFLTEEVPDGGITAADLESLPNGEITIAVIAPKRKNPVFLVAIELDEENESVEKTIGFIRDRATEGGAEFETEESDDATFETMVVEGQRITYFQKDGMLVGSNSEDELKAYLDRWMGREVKKIRPLTKNRKYITIMNRCRSTEDLPAEIKVFADPIELIRSSFRGNMAAQAALNFMPVFGVDGLLGVGGTVTLFEQEFESVFHGHVLLANPRKGVFEMIALKPGSYEPETWIPNDVAFYSTTSWDAQKMYSEIAQIVDTFNGEDFMQEQVDENINQQFDIDFEKDLIGSLTGRVSICQWMQPPMRFNSGVVIFGLELKDPAKVEELIEKFLEAVAEDGDTTEYVHDYKGIRYWAAPENERQEERRQRRQERMKERGMEIEIRPEEPTFAILGNYLLMGNSPELIKRAIDTDRGEIESLATNEEYLEVGKKITRLVGNDMPSGILYSRPGEQWRALLEAAKSEGTKATLANQSEGNKLLTTLQNTLEENPLPEFEDIEKYLQPSGMMVVNDDTGYHLLVFQLRHDREEALALEEKRKKARENK